MQSAFQAKGKEFPRWTRPVVAISLLLIGLSLSTFGLINLVARGYGTISYGVFLVYVFPMLTTGIYKIFFSRGTEHEK